MTSNQLRQSFIEFFRTRGHRVVPGDSLVPSGDPTVLFTPAGMNQFKEQFLAGPEVPLEFTRATTCQKCLRTDDIEHVGYTAGHHTFFEMLGNFSFGDYFKEEAIACAWELVTEALGLEADRLLVSVYEDDDEAAGIWEREIGIPADRIYHFDVEENFWPANAPEDGPDGVCGPCSELFYDQGEEYGCGRPECDPSCQCDRYVEIYNLVFTQFDRQGKNNLIPLPKRNIDTGMGLERTAAVLQGVPNNFQNDVFQPIVASVCDLTRTRDKTERGDTVRLHRIADHLRAAVFAIADGCMPGNAGRGYVVRRLIRRAAFDGFRLGTAEPFLYRLVPVVVEVMQEPYPELVGRREHVAVVLKGAEESFRQTLERGSQILDEYVTELRRSRQTVLDGGSVFRLYDTFGLPLEAIESILAEEGLSADREGFEREMERQRERARRGARLGGIFAPGEAGLRLSGGLETPEFVGYERLQSQARVVELLDESNQPSGALGEGTRGAVVLDTTPFYAEAGGQVGDVGLIEGEGFQFQVEDTQRAQDIVLHLGRVTSGALKKSTVCTARVDAARRQAIKRSHTATHLLHAALREVLGPHAQQSGSLVAPDRLRFDFTHTSHLTPDEVREVELFVNQRIVENRPVAARTTGLREALADGIIALFGEKYGDEVRLVEVGGRGDEGAVSRELCGGTHCERTGDVGGFIIAGEEAVAAGIRRVTAVTGLEATRQWEEQRRTLERVAGVLGAPLGRVLERAEEVVTEMKTARRELDRRREAEVRQGSTEAARVVGQVGGTQVVVVRLPEGDDRGLRSAADEVRRRFGSVAAALGTTSGGRAQVVVALSRDLVERGLSARRLVAGVGEELGGGGGGRDDLAQAGGARAEALDAALDRFAREAEAALKA